MRLRVSAPRLKWIMAYLVLGGHYCAPGAAPHTAEELQYRHQRNRLGLSPILGMI
jgi:hypothetical protein